MLIVTIEKNKETWYNLNIPFVNLFFRHVVLQRIITEEKNTISNKPHPAADRRYTMAIKKANPLMDRIKEEFPRKLQLLYSVSPEEASDKQVYHVLSSIIVEILGAKRQSFINHTHSVLRL